MVSTFSKLWKRYEHVWIAILIDIAATLTIGLISKFNKLSELLSETEFLEKYIDNNSIIDNISRYTGIGLGVILVIYLIVLILFIFLAFGLPSITYYICEAATKHSVVNTTSKITWAIGLISFIPGIWCTTKAILLFAFLAEAGIVLIHLLVLFILQAYLIAYYMISMLKDILGRGNHGQT